MTAASRRIQKRRSRSELPQETLLTLNRLVSIKCLIINLLEYRDERIMTSSAAEDEGSTSAGGPPIKEETDYRQSLPSPIPILKESYSLKPDMIYGWKPADI
jgi:hypothetical protein